jgi:hypothetical protein
MLLLGETGTGKGVLARAVHQAGPRRGGRFVDVNCAAIPETLLEAELFGYERGAFTDARQAKPGLFQTAHGGTIFLDEIGLLPLALQGKLLGVLEDRAVRRLGAIRAEPVDVALIAATGVDLNRAVGERTFRADLYHRLAVITLELPPLRERGSDILALAQHFLARACADYGLSPRTLTADTRDQLLIYHWPGNVRELANTMERAALLSTTEKSTPDMLGFLADNVRPVSGEPVGPLTRDSREAVLRATIEATLRRHAGNIRRTAAALGISRNTLRARMDRYGLRHPDTARGTDRPEALRARAAVAPAPWERRQLPLLQARVQAATPLQTTRSLELIADKVGSFGGRLEETGPGDVVAVFGLEPADNAPSLAALAALAIQTTAAHGHAEVGDAPVITVAIHCAEHLVSQPAAAPGSPSTARPPPGPPRVSPGSAPGVVGRCGRVVPDATLHLEGSQRVARQLGDPASRRRPVGLDLAALRREDHRGRDTPASDRSHRARPRPDGERRRGRRHRKVTPPPGECRPAVRLARGRRGRRTARQGHAVFPDHGDPQDRLRSRGERYGRGSTGQGCPGLAVHRRRSG